MFNIEKKMYKIGLFSYLSLFLLSLLFYKERTVFLDIAYHMFIIIKDNALAIQNNRFGAAVTQVFPLMASRFSLPIEVIAKIYSACFVLYYFVCYFLCGTILKQYKIALVLLLSTMLFVTDTFYWIQSELPQGLSFLLLFFAFINSLKDDRRSLYLFPLIVFGVVTLVFFHPLIVFPFFFVLFYYFLLDKGYKDKLKVVISAFLLFAICLAIKTLKYKTSYDDNATEGVNNFIYLFPQYFNLHNNKVFLKSCLTTYQWIPIIATLISITLFIQKKWLKLITFLIAFVGMILLVNVSYAFTELERFYSENLYLPIGIILAVPFVVDVIPLISKSKKYAWVSYALVITILISGVIRIYSASGVFADRLNWERVYLNEHKNEKLLVRSTEKQRKKLIMTWATSYEFWLLSSLEHNSPASIVITDNIQDVEWAQGGNANFITMWGVFDYKDMPSLYFNFKDTTSRYKVIK